MIAVYRGGLLLLLSLALAVSAEARQLSAEGYGDSVDAARNEALNALASSIFVQIESSSELYEDSSGDSNFSASTRSSTDLPLIGVSFDCYAVQQQQLCQATMDSAAASVIYRQRVEQLVADIDSGYQALPKVAAADQHDQLLNLLASFEEYEKFSTVLLFIQGDAAVLARPAVSRRHLQDSLLALESAVSSLSLAAKLLLKGVEQSSLYIQPAMLQNSREVTPFASALLQQLKQARATVASPEAADFIFSGGYQQHDKGITVSYSLTDKKSNTLKTALVELLPAAYSRYDSKPKALDFDRLLHKGYAVASDFAAEIATNKGQRQLLFRDGETVQLLVKLNRSGYFYLVGYTKSDGDEQSYLMDLNEAAGDRRFVYFVNADAVNKWISLGEFDVAEPYGVESLQLIASQQDLVNGLPSYRFDPASEYYVLSHDIEKTIAKTRGLKKKKMDKQAAAKTSEAVLMFTTSR